MSNIEYNVKSEHAAEFIHDGEIRATLEYAKERCNDKALIEEILKKADEGKGISHREAAVLLEVRDEETRVQTLNQMSGSLLRNTVYCFRKG